MEEASKKSHYRGKARRGRRVTVHYRVLAHGELQPEVRAQTRNIGVGGAFIETPDPSPPGTRLVVTMTLDGGVTLDAQAEVRWIMDGDEDPFTGMGVKFLGLDTNQQRQLNDYCAALPTTDDLDDLLGG